MAGLLPAGSGFLPNLPPALKTTRGTCLMLGQFKPEAELSPPGFQKPKGMIRHHFHSRSDSANLNICLSHAIFSISALHS